MPDVRLGIRGTHSFNLSNFIHVRLEVPLSSDIQRTFSRVFRLDFGQQLSELFGLDPDFPFVFNIVGIGKVWIILVVGIVGIRVVVVEAIAIGILIWIVAIVVWISVGVVGIAVVVEVAELIFAVVWVGAISVVVWIGAISVVVWIGAISVVVCGILERD
jgi:hypothetical protein